jgi:outer membrane protein assembly factor BamE
MDAPELPSERDFVSAIDTAKTRRSVPNLALSDEQIKALPTPAPAASAAAPAEPPPRSYPPLEPRG